MKLSLWTFHTLAGVTSICQGLIRSNLFCDGMFPCSICADPTFYQLLDECGQPGEGVLRRDPTATGDLQTTGADQVSQHPSRLLTGPARSGQVRSAPVAPPHWPCKVRSGQQLPRLLTGPARLGRSCGRRTPVV